MSVERPFFSVVLPTYNRAFILPLAIESVLNQSFQDFELIVSNSASSDNTKDVVLKFKDHRLRYVETDQRLSMGDNYEYALNHARGEYTVFFSDDDAFVPTMLEKVRSVIMEHDAKLIVFPFAYYYKEGANEFSWKIEKNSLLFSPFTGQCWEVDCSEDINRLLAICGLSRESESKRQIGPLIGNIVCHRSITNLLKSKTPKLFASVPVDFYFLTLMLNVIDRYYIFDEPLLVWSQWKHNSSVFKTKDFSLREHYKKLLEGETLRFVPLKFTLPLNCAANAVLHARSELGKSADHLPVDWSCYFVRMYENLKYLQGDGIDIDEEMKEFNQVLSAQPLELQQQVRKETLKRRFLLKQTIKKSFPGISYAVRFVLGRLKYSLHNKIEFKKIVIRGEEVGFNNVLESARYLDSVLDSHMASGHK